MTIGTVLLASWLSFGVLPQGAIDLYERPLSRLDGSFVAELGVDASWKGAFFSASITTPVWFDPLSLSFFPTQASYTIEAGFRTEDFRIAWRHNCAHPVVPGFAFLSQQIVPRWESAYDMLYVTIGRKP